MKKVIILKGLPASGKSTWAKEQVKKDPHGYLRINKDDLRQMLFNSEFGGKKEAEVLAVRDTLIKHGLLTNKTVIVDDTNLNPIHEDNIKKIAEQTGAIWETKFFDVSLAECIDRDTKRLGRDKVGKDVITKMYNDYLKPINKIEFNPALPSAIIVDMDGTLALNNTGRSFYDEAKAIDDEICIPVQLTIRAIQKLYETNNSPFKIIIVSGRDEGRGRAATSQWLKNYYIPHDLLLMRSSGDVRSDNIIKKEIYDTFIKGNYNILFVLDDRDSVVAAWRDLGLTCFQVADGNF